MRGLPRDLWGRAYVVLPRCAERRARPGGQRGRDAFLATIPLRLAAAHLDHWTLTHATMQRRYRNDETAPTSANEN